MKVARTLIAVTCLFSAGAAWSFVPETRQREALWIEPSRAAAPSAESARSAALEHRAGGRWEERIDARTGKPVLIQGSGIPFVPGRGNSLGESALEGIARVDGELTIDALEPRMRRFLAESEPQLLPTRGALVLDRNASMIRDGGRLATFQYIWEVDGVPVEGANVFARVNSGNITQMGAPFVGPITISGQPVVDAGGAVHSLMAYTGDGEIGRLLRDPELLIQVEDGQAGSLSHRLVWKVTYRILGKIETWEGRVDARTGLVVAFRDTNAYARVVGGVYPRTVFENNETTAPMPASDVSADGSTLLSDNAGAYAYTGGTASTGLNGRWFNTACQGCSNPAAPQASIDIGSGFLEFGIGGNNEIGNGFSTPADRNSFFHLNQIRRLVIKWLPTFGFANQLGFTSNVNITSTCNAVYTGNAVNFYRSGDGCNNTGEVADVMYHEYGHGVDLNSNGGDGATGEATADVVSMQLTRSPLVGPGFKLTGAPVRNLDKDTTSKGILTVGNVLVKCSCTGSQTCGPLGGEVHCEGEIYGQAAWELGEALAAKHGQHTGWRESERIFFLSLPDANGYLPSDAQPVYDAYINADDDDGNLANGTPNGQEIFDVFDLHGMATGPQSSSPGCTRPGQPLLQVTPQCGSFDLSWSTVSGAVSYEVFRGELIEDSGYFPVATLPAGTTTYEDGEVAPGVDYYYTVMAVDAGGCESTVENPVAANLPPQPILSVTAVTADDTVGGNSSGFPDPNEEIALDVTLANIGQLGSSFISGTLTSPTAGVTIVDGTSDWPDLGSGGSAANLDALSFTTNEAEVQCGQNLRFQIVPSEASGCPADTSYFEVTLGEPTELAADDFESDLGWTQDTVNSTASTGAWVRIDPQATSHQPGDDVTPGAGVNAFVTAANPSGSAGQDDVDNGVAILLSPLFDLSSAADVEVSYHRWFSMSEVGTDSGDFFSVDVSNDGGQNWTNLETLDFNSPAPAWTRQSFLLDAVLSLTDSMQFRFSAADGTFDGSIVEAAIDEFRLERFVCDSAPACFDEPTFGGIDFVGGGASCGELDLVWLSGSSNCVDGEISYNVYRSTSPGFVPGPGTLVAAGVDQLAHTDTLLDPGTTYYYIVRADDSRSGEDSNLVELAASAPVAPDNVAPLFAGLDAAQPGAGCSETVLTWSAAEESCSGPVAYDVYRSADPGFTPGPATLVATTYSPGLVDVTAPGAAASYVVRARDTAGNDDGNTVRLTTAGALLDSKYSQTSFEPNGAGWVVSGDIPSGQNRGRWDWGNPAGTAYQPEDDATPGGVNCWMTGVAAGASNNDVDDGTTVLTTRPIDMDGSVAPVVRYQRWFTNDQGGSPGDPTDDFVVEVSNDDGQNWSTLETVGAGTPLAWVPVALPVPIAPTSAVRLRFTAADLGAGSVVEAGIDDFEIIDPGQGCSVSSCATGPTPLCSIDVRKAGDDIVIRWGTDPGLRVVIYAISGCGERVLVGTVDGGTEFVHENAALSDDPFNYRVTLVDECGTEVDFCGATDCPN